MCWSKLALKGISYMDVSNIQKITLKSSVGLSVTIVKLKQNKLDLVQIYGFQRANIWLNLEILYAPGIIFREHVILMSLYHY
jgi:hypothetical protein